ncbi:HPP family protein [Decorospora gaudefroyi]|uniref:HPP family protein n=1 Tax=Decorospora gaudefroyi TaxID=184978 RepID=A0A6A5KBB9_9PLEO|nr:HPP family protein [Decorospora gaudefroyi]
MPTIFSQAREWDIDIDRYLNRIVPASPLHRLPAPVSRFLGYRAPTTTAGQQDDVGNVMGALWSLLGAFCGLAVVAVVFGGMESIRVHRPPALIASFGASAILEYNSIRSPLGQPRNALLGHTFSALIGVGIAKLFQHHGDYEGARWVAGAVACGCASAVMLVTNTVHPPGGASAVLAATDPVIMAMGWYFVGLVMWGTTLMLVVGLVVNNVQRQFPVYWWTPMDLRRARRIEINGVEVLVPRDLGLSGEEERVLSGLRARLRKRGDGEMEMDSGRSSAEVTVVSSRGGSARIAGV